MSVGHDIWDGKRKKINDLSIFYTHPVTLVTRRVPIALAKVMGITAIEVSALSMRGLERAGVEFFDLFRAVNDNCAAAIATGRL